MKLEPQTNAELDKLGRIVKDIGTAMLASLADDGSLVTRPLETLQLNAEGELVFFTSANSAKVAQLTEDRHVNLAYVDSANKRYLSVRGQSRMDRDEDTINALWSMEQKVFFPQGKNDPELMVLRVKVRDAMYWEAASGNILEQALDFAQGLVSDEPEDLGTREHLRGSDSSD